MSPIVPHCSGPGPCSCTGGGSTHVNTPQQRFILCYRVKDLRLYLIGRSVAMDHCTEKNDLVELVLKSNDSAEYFREQTEARRRADAMRVRLCSG